MLRLCLISLVELVFVYGLIKSQRVNFKRLKIDKNSRILLKDRRTSETKCKMITFKVNELDNLVKKSGISKPKRVSIKNELHLNTHFFRSWNYFFSLSSKIDRRRLSKYINCTWWSVWFKTQHKMYHIM